MNEYTIRYRCDDGRGGVALVVEDGQDSAYLFSGGVLQARLTGDAACARLVRHLRRCAPWTPVPGVSPYTLDGLRRLTRTLESVPGGR